ncbi:MAG: DUF2849 domain-containing protein [Rhodovibrionaceae bacterium]|nr:DUF2849 domain-containing protein [Rhodovibrionaceae bacterium]
MPHLKLLTANRLTDGVVVFLGADGDWQERLETLRPIREEETLAERELQAEADVAAQRVVGPYPIDVVEDDGDRLRPLRLREVIRAAGPTVRLDLGKQAEA